MANPTPIVVTDSNGNSLTITGATSGTQFAAPTPCVLTDVNGNALNLGAGGGGGGVTSVGLTDSTGLFTVTGSPVTTSGSLTLSAFASKSQNLFLASPNGSSGAPTFRAIVAADIPTLNQNTTGTAGGLTGTPAITVGALINTTQTASGLITAQANINLGVVGGASGTITLVGTTSGTATIAGPATAGTITNPITISNSVQLASGTALSWNGDVGISRSSAGNLFFGNGTNGSTACNIFATSLGIAGGAATYGSKVTTYNAVNTVSGGIPAIFATVDSTGLVASVSTTTLYAVTAGGAGQYRVSGNAKITTAGTSPVIGPLTITYTDPDSNVCAMIIPWSNSAGSVSAAGNAANSVTQTGVMLFSDILINCKASTNIQYAFPVSGTVGSGAWNLHLKCEAL